MRRIGAQLAGIAVLVAAVGPVGSTEAFAGPALPDSSTLSSPVVLQGHLTDSGGAALSGAEVLLSAWPSNETVKAMPIGGTFRNLPVARAVADSTGAYTLRSALTPALAALIDRDGLDLQLDVAHQGHLRTYLTQAVPGGTLGWLRPTVEAVDPAQLIAALPRNSLNISLPADDGPHPCGNTEGCEDKPRPYPGLPSGCVNRKIAVKEAWTTVATAVARNGVTAKVTYGRGAKSEVSTGVSYDGTGGSFKSGPTRTRESTFEADFYDQKGTKKKVANVEYQVEMAHAVFASECNGNKVGQYRYRQFTTEPMGTTGATQIIPSRLPLWTCAKAKGIAGGRAATTSYRAYTYERGFGFSPVPGGSFTGAATSGYSETVKVEYYFANTKGKRNYWCGLTGNPNSPGQRVQAFQK